MLCLQVWSQCLREVLLIVYACFCWLLELMLIYVCVWLVVNGCFCWLLELMLIYLRLEAFNVSGAKVAFYVANCFVQLWSHYLKVFECFL